MKATRQTPKKRAYKVPFQTYIIKHHSAAYRVYKGKLYFYPIYENKSIDYSRGAIVEESPKDFRSGHRIAMIQLRVSINVQRKVIGQIGYY